ncbi:uncharacterized protein Dana_GF19557, isoform C [Drosophila ananassae]|nr:uncharacterized protein LOC6502313 isoform X2 [Drosophila ananassae]XP_032311927.1 uncharacterized protein LOC116656435 isoform X2 [Drosophila ananassae]KPU75281.1 uncharacterized protein Dana_GF19557, isoform C [Drosophila ananassae]
MPKQAVRPISTYDNLGATQQLQSHVDCTSTMLKPELELEPKPTESGTSHSIAAVKAALNDAKSKFFGINSCESPVAIKQEPKYQNVPQRDFLQEKSPPVAAVVIVSNPTTVPLKDLPEKTLCNSTVYEEIPLRDLDALQPSQAVYMSTTVPQNIKSMKIAGRHTPTRNSLRHSRMIVVNHHNHDSLHTSYSRHILNLNISRQMLILQLAIGILISSLSLWILWMGPIWSVLINPYLSGLSLLLAGVIGLIILRRHRKEHRSSNNCYKVEACLLPVVALIFCCLALVCATIEFSELSSSVNGTCGPATSWLMRHRHCTCFSPTADDAIPGEKSPAIAVTTDGKQPLSGETDAGEKDGSEKCSRFRTEWKYLLAFSMVLNSLGIITTFLCITLFICSRPSRKQIYTSV